MPGTPLFNKTNVNNKPPKFLLVYKWISKMEFLAKNFQKTGIPVKTESHMPGSIRQQLSENLSFIW